jgi:flavin-dependent dehydrogenase
MVPVKVDYLLIGAGMAGLVLRRFLNSSDRVVLIDHNPGAYKIGESVVPEQFHHPIMRALLPEVEKLPSYSPKFGTTFVSDDSIASFPLPESEAGVAMHVSRPEIEQLMIREWGLDIVREKVLEVDLAAHRVTTDKNVYEVDQQIIDCSGPAMVVGSLLKDVSSLWPVWATWGYYDITENDDARFHAEIVAQRKKYLRYDAVRRRVLESGEIVGWSPSRTTILTKEGDGLWTWQIPLFHSTRLSMGVVSRHGPISKERYLEITEMRHAPNYTLARRPEDGSSHFNRYYSREGFARRCGTPATMDYILLADAFGFADPVYSVGTAIAVNKAIELADLLNNEGWSESSCAQWCEESEAQLKRAIAGFELWYSGELMQTEDAANEVRDNFLLGTAFQAKTAEHYGTLLRDASLNRGEFRRDLEVSFQVRWHGPSGRSTEAMRRLLGLRPEQSLVGWHMVEGGIRPGGLQIRWLGQPRSELVMDLDLGGSFPCFLKAGAIGLSHLDGFNDKSPFGPAVERLFKAVAARVMPREHAWQALRANL